MTGTELRPRKGIPQLASQKLAEAGGAVGKWAVRSALRFVDVQPMYDSLEHSHASRFGFVRRGRNVVGSGITGFIFPLATGIAQSEKGEGKGGKVLVAFAGMLDLFAWGGGGITLFVGAPFIPTALWRLGASALTEMLPRRKVVKDARSRRSH